jgi:hypothetical protein
LNAENMRVITRGGYRFRRFDNTGVHCRWIVHDHDNSTSHGMADINGIGIFRAGSQRIAIVAVGCMDQQPASNHASKNVAQLAVGVVADNALDFSPRKSTPWLRAQQVGNPSGAKCIGKFIHCGRLMPAAVMREKTNQHGSCRQV